MAARAIDGVGDRPVELGLTRGSRFLQAFGVRQRRRASPPPCRRRCACECCRRSDAARRCRPTRQSDARPRSPTTPSRRAAPGSCGMSVMLVWCAANPNQRAMRSGTGRTRPVQRAQRCVRTRRQASPTGRTVPVRPRRSRTHAPRDFVRASLSPELNAHPPSSCTDSRGSGRSMLPIGATTDRWDSRGAGNHAPCESATIITGAVAAWLLHLRSDGPPTARACPRSPELRSRP